MCVSVKEDAMWDLKPGETVVRAELQKKFGGRTQGGIGPSKISPNVLIFSDPETGEQHGYIDGWQKDGCFHYTGEGQRGDQQMKSGNRSIRDHVREKRALRLFQGTRGKVRYIDEFKLDADLPYYYTDAPETGDGPTRSVIVFRLRPKTITTPTAHTRHRPIAASDDEAHIVEEVAIEEQWTERVFVNPRQEQTEAERREATLVVNFRDFMRARGEQVVRLKILPKGEAKPIFSDIYVKSSKLLVEAKGTVERGAIRMALGQLLDYQRFIDQPRCALLVPTQPRSDLMNLILGSNVELFWKEEDIFYKATKEIDGTVSKEAV